MTAKSVAPVLADPGFGRTWVVESRKVLRKTKWGAVLVSRVGTTVGYVVEYDNGWGADMIVRGKVRMVHGGRPFGSAQAAADALLKARRAKR